MDAVLAERMGIADWIKFLDKLRNKAIRFVPVEWLAEKTGKQRDSLRVALKRLERYGLLSRVGRRWIILPPMTLAEAIPHVWSPSYLSLEWALNYHEILDQVTYWYTAVTTGKEGKQETSLGTVALYHIPRKLFFGFDKQYVASPEKAILDLIYVRGELKIAPDLNWEFVDRKLLDKMAIAYPKRVQLCCQSI